MVAYVAADKRFVVLDFREVAPAAATAERYARLNADQGDGPSPTVYGGNAAGVPGQLAGLAEIQRRFTTRPLPELIQPAIKLAEAGFAADEEHNSACRGTIANYEKWPQLKQQHACLYRTLLSNGTLPAIGDRIKRPALAKALELVATNGPDAFYKGPLGEAVVRAVNAAGGIMTMEDLAAYRVRERKPIRADYRGFELVSMPPPSSGGVCLAQTLQIMQAADERSDLHPVFDRPYLQVEALKHAFADRARWLGDPDFARIPVRRLTDPHYAIELARRINYSKTQPSEAYGTKSPPPDDGGTSHFCIADKAGNVVALTETVNGVFGSLVVAEPFGIILNNQMDDFAADPGKPNLYGLIQGEANAVAPGKRPLSSMSPTIVMKDGRPVLVLGASGGPRIITSVLQVMLNVLDSDMPLDKAITAVRIHHQWLPDEVYFNQDPPPRARGAADPPGPHDQSEAQGRHRPGNPVPGRRHHDRRQRSAQGRPAGGREVTPALPTS